MIQIIQVKYQIIIGTESWPEHAKNGYKQLEN